MSGFVHTNTLGNVLAQTKQDNKSQQHIKKLFTLFRGFKKWTRRCTQSRKQVPVTGLRFPSGAMLENTKKMLKKQVSLSPVKFWGQVEQVVDKIINFSEEDAEYTSSEYAQLW